MLLVPIQNRNAVAIITAISGSYLATSARNEQMPPINNLPQLMYATSSRNQTQITHHMNDSRINLLSCTMFITFAFVYYFTVRENIPTYTRTVSLSLDQLLISVIVFVADVTGCENVSWSPEAKVGKGRG
jgi:uncharacterized membrane protein YoaT (DUF817 family)